MGFEDFNRSLLNRNAVRFMFHSREHAFVTDYVEIRAYEWYVIVYWRNAGENTRFVFVEIVSA